MDFLQTLQDFTDSLPTALQFLGVAVSALVPFVEGEGAAIIGALAGVNPWLSIPVAILGLGLIFLSKGFRTRTAKGSAVLAQAKVLVGSIKVELTGYEGLAASGMDAVFDNMMNGTAMITSRMLGMFRSNASTRRELLSLIGQRGTSL